MTPSLAALALPVAAGGVVVSTGGQINAHSPEHLLALAVSAGKAYRGAVTGGNPAVMAKILAPAADSDPTGVVPGAGGAWGSGGYQTPGAGGAGEGLPFGG